MTSPPSALSVPLGTARAEGLTAADYLADYHWNFDTANRSTQFGSLLDTTVNYTYDHYDQLTGVTGPGVNESYNYDINGNRGQTIGPNNQVLSVVMNGQTFQFSYDDEANLQQKTNTVTGVVTNYSWDWRNRLTLVVTKSSSTGPETHRVAYTYDPFDRRTSKTVDPLWSVYRAAGYGLPGPDFPGTVSGR